MKMPFFITWLQQHTRKQNPFGDFAKRANELPGFPRTEDYVSIRMFLRNHLIANEDLEAFYRIYACYALEYAKDHDSPLKDLKDHLDSPHGVYDRDLGDDYYTNRD